MEKEEKEKEPTNPKHEWAIGICTCCKQPIKPSQKWILLETPLMVGPKPITFLVHRNKRCLDNTMNIIFSEMRGVINSYDHVLDHILLPRWKPKK